MNTKFFLAGLVLIILSYGFSAKAEPIPEKVEKCVAYICVPNDKETTPIGTGFFISYIYESLPDKYYVFLVTARHVVIDENGNIRPRLFLRMNDKASGHSTDYDDIKANLWFFHEEYQSVDIAVHPLLPSKADFLYVKSEDIVTDNFMKEKNIGIGDDIFYVGLLSYLSGKDRIAPIVRFGRLSLRTDEKTVDGKFYHFIDAGNIPGHSGSPVFLWATPARTSNVLAAGPRIFGLYGIVSGMIEYNKRLQVTMPKETTVRPVPIDARSGGITAVVPAKYLIEILNSKQIRNLLKVDSAK